MAAAPARTRTSRSWSPKKNRSSSETPEDGYIHGANDSSVPDRGFGLTDYNRAKEYPSVGEKEESIPDLGFGLRCMSAGPRRRTTGPRVGEDDSTVPDLGFGLRRGGSERAPNTAPKVQKDGVEEIIMPKRAYTLGTEASPSKPIPHISTKDCSKFLDDLKTSVEAVRQTANERRSSGKFSPSKAPEAEKNGSSARKGSQPEVFIMADDGHLTDDCSDEDLEQEAGLKKVESNAGDIKRAIEEMESQLPKLPKVNKFLKTVGVDSHDAGHANSPVEEPNFRSEMYDCLVQTIDALQSMASAVLQEGEKLEGILARARGLPPSGGKEIAPDLADALAAELTAHIAHVDHQAKLAVETKEALAAVVSALSPVLPSMSNEQRRGMEEILSEAKSDQHKLDNLEGRLEKTRMELQNALDAVNKATKARKVSLGKSGADLEKEVQSLKKLLDGKEALIKDLQKEVKSLKDQQTTRETKQASPTGPTAGVTKIGGLSAKGVVLTPKNIGGSSGSKLTQKKSAPAGPTSNSGVKGRPTPSSVSASTSPTKSVRLSDLAPAKLGTK